MFTIISERIPSISEPGRSGIAARGNCLSCNKQLAWCESRQASATCTLHLVMGILFEIKREEELGMVETVYCVKCKKKTTQNNAQQITMKNGSPAQKGTCSVCGTTTQQILPKTSVSA
jgi:Domain of unknown function (DUF5679)